MGKLEIDATDAIEIGLNALTDQDLIQVEEHGARIYLVQDAFNSPLLVLSLGDPTDSGEHDWVDLRHRHGPSVFIEVTCYQDEETKMPPDSLREYLDGLCHEKLAIDWTEAVEYSQL